MRTRTLTAALLALLMLLGAPAVASAHPLPHPAPAIHNPRPAPGALVAPGPITIAALVTAPVQRHVVTLDGRELESSSSGGSHPTVSADANVDAGWHTIEVVAATPEGEASRAWRFAVGALEVERLAGATRVTTAVAISRDARPQPGSADAAVLANAGDLAVALAGAPLASQAGGPLLLTSGRELEAPVADELQRVLGDAAPVYLLGGPAVMSEAVAADIRQLGLRPERVDGGDAYATAAAVAGTLPAADTVIVASGESLADALSVSAPAAARGYPIVLTEQASLPAATRSFVADGRWATVLVIGGPQAISPAVLEELTTTADGAEVVRIAGPTRFETARAVARTFYGRYDTVAVASGQSFPDAVSGGPHAALAGAPILLVADGQVPAPQRTQLESHDVARAVVYGGAAAVSGSAVEDLRSTVASAGGPHVVEFTPGEGTVVQTLDELVIEFDRALDLGQSTIMVTAAGHEVAGTLSAGDFPRTMVFVVDDLPEGLAAGNRYPVTVTVAATDGRKWRFLERNLIYEKPIATLARGDSGPAVAELQRRLQAAGYWVGDVDGEYANLTHQAVLALQKVHGLQRDGIYGPNTRAVLEAGPPRPAARSTSGLVVEVDKSRQVLLIVSDGEVAHIFNSATGTGEPYEYAGDTYIADTPSGEFRIFRQIDGWRTSHLGRLYRPKYFNGGIALHGSTSVPAYPASHGCVRVSIPAMDFLWSRLPIGVPVLVYG